MILVKGMRGVKQNHIHESIFVEIADADLMKL